VLVLLIFQYSALGLLVSSYVHRADAGVRVTYAAVFALAFLTLGPNYLYQGKGGLLSAAAMYLRHLSPVPIVMQIAGHGDVGSQGLMGTSVGVAEFFGLGILLTLIFVGVTISRLNYRLFDRARSKGVMTEERSLVVRLLRRLVFLIDPQRRKPGTPWYLNAVMIKEFRSRRFGRSHWLIRLVAVCAVASLVLTLATTMGTMDWGVETIGGLMVLLQVTLVVLIAPSLSAGLISTERETGGWDLLRMTPLSASSILGGKLLSVLWTLVLILMATLPGYLVMIYIKPVMWLQVYLVLICLLLAALHTLLVSALVSSMFARTAPATTTAYLVLIALYLGPLLIWFGRERPFGHRFVEWALTTNPMGAALAVIGTPGFTQYELIPITWWICGVFMILLLIALGAQTWRLTRAF
jgi:hypothetical protein